MGASASGGTYWIRHQHGNQSGIGQALRTKKQLDEEQSLQEEQANSGGHAKQNNLENRKEGTQEWM